MFVLNSRGVIVGNIFNPLVNLLDYFLLFGLSFCSKPVLVLVRAEICLLRRAISFSNSAILLSGAALNSLNLEAFTFSISEGEVILPFSRMLRCFSNEEICFVIPSVMFFLFVFCSDIRLFFFPLNLFPKVFVLFLNRTTGRRKQTPAIFQLFALSSI